MPAVDSLVERIGHYSELSGKRATLSYAGNATVC